MELPKLNMRKKQSKLMQTKLKLELLKLIDKFETENDYKFEAYEVDNMLLSVVKENHEGYLRAKFGDYID